MGKQSKICFPIFLFEKEVNYEITIGRVVSITRVYSMGCIDFIDLSLTPGRRQRSVHPTDVPMLNTIIVLSDF